MDQLVTDLKRMVKNCEYIESTDTMVRDRLIFGIRDVKVQYQLFRTDVEKLTLEKALSYYRAGEATDRIKELRRTPGGKMFSLFPKREIMKSRQVRMARI